MMDPMHLYYMMQQFSMLELPYVFKKPALPPWREKKRFKKQKNLQDCWTLAPTQVNDVLDLKLCITIYVKQPNTPILEAPSSTHKIKQKNSHKKVFKFTIGQTQKLLVYLMKNLNCRMVSDLKNRAINDDQWKKVTKRVRLPLKYTKKYWYHKLHMQLFCPEPIIMKKVVIKLIKFLHETIGQSMTWEDIRSARFDGYTTEFLSKLYKHLSELARIKANSNKSEDIINYLYNNYIPVVEKMKCTWILPRLDHILRRIDSVPDSSRCNLLLDTKTVIKSYVEPFKDSIID